MSVYILGPSLSSVVEPAPLVPVTPPLVVAGRIGIAFHPTTPTQPGGKVNFALLAAVLPTDVRPKAVYAVYVQPPESVPDVGPLRTADWFMKSGQPMASVVVPAPPVDPGQMYIIVPGVKPGIHFVQTILEYDT